MADLSLPLIDPERLGSVERVTPGAAMMHGFANVAYVYGKGGVLVADTSSPALGPRAVEGLRGLTDEKLRVIVYTHGHADHVGGAQAFLDDTKARGHEAPRIWAHRSVGDRFARYARTWGWNNEVNRRQFALPSGAAVFPKSFVAPTDTYETAQAISLEGEPIELIHASAETDDATWLWFPDRKIAVVGDLIIHSLPNLGNPNKPRRDTLGWAEALEAVARRGPLYLLPGHGPPVSGPLVMEILINTATALRHLHDAVVERLNAGRWPHEILAERIALPDALAAKPYLRPTYGCTEFIVRDVLRTYAGWWDGRPQELLPEARRVAAGDLLALIGREALMHRVRTLCEAGKAKRALHLASVLVEACPEDEDGRVLFSDVLKAVEAAEPSYIARSFYAAARGPRP